MKNKKIVSHKQKLDAIFAKIGDLGADAELMSHWSRYLCVLVSGFMEMSIRTLVAEYVSRRAAPEVAYFIGQRLKVFQNAKTNKILDLIGEFGNEYRQNLDQRIDDEMKDAVDSIVTNRHSIAHGRDVGIGFATLKQYYTNVVKAIEEVEGLLGS